MKKPTLKPIIAAICAAGILTVPTVRAASDGHVDFGKLSALATEGGQFVEVNVRSNLIAMVARLAETQEPEAAGLLKRLHQVHVNVIGLSEENREALGEKVKSIRAQLEADGWDRVVTVKERDQDVGVYLKLRDEEAVEGIVVTVIDPGQAGVFINVVGDIRPEELAEIGERFRIEPLKEIGLATTGR
ncbi:MAG TPA: DUF4252 domain-containing protein [Methylomirabilota bacterium]|nr:DUF4252 domain-containing protein [Methylomirabilota bacterium]